MIQKLCLRTGEVKYKSLNRVNLKEQVDILGNSLQFQVRKQIPLSCWKRLLWYHQSYLNLKNAAEPEMSSFFGLPFLKYAIKLQLAAG